MIDKFLMKAIANKKKYYMSLGIGTLPIVFSTLAHTLLLAYIIDQVFLKHQTLQGLVQPLTALFFIFAIKPLFNYLHERRGRKSATLAKLKLRSQLTQAINTHYQTLENENTTGLYATLACEGIESTDAYFAEFVPQLFLMAANTLILLFAGFYLDWISALIMLITAPLIPLFMMLIGKTSEGVNLKQWDSLKRMNGHLLDLLRGLVTLRAFGMDLKQVESVGRTSENFRKKTLSVLVLTFLSAFALELTATLSTAMIAVSLGFRLIYGNIDFFPALAVLLLAPEYYLPLRQLGLKYHAAMNAKGVSLQLKPLLEKDLPVGSELNQTKSQLGIEPTIISIQNLSFAYGDHQIFNNFTTRIPLKGATALTGASGVGKTTLLKLLSGDLTPTYGTIRIGLLPPSPELIAVVPQHPRIFMGTLADNLKFGNPQVDLSTILDACALTGFDQVLNRLPQGLDTPLGDGFQSLSGGETQLLALTRAYLRQTPVLLLDEPSSALDPLSEQLMATALEKLSHHKGLVIAAHREASIALCTHRIHLEGGAHHE